jgi:hypothetical protein
MDEGVYEKFDSYNWEGDQAFKVRLIFVLPADAQTGVQKVLGLKNIPDDSPEAGTLVEKYKLFYFSKYFCLKSLLIPDELV